MIDQENTPFQVVLYEGRGAGLMEASMRWGLMGQLLDQGYWVTRVAPDGGGFAKPAGRLLVLGQFPDGTPALEDAAGEIELDVRDISGLDEALILALVEERRGAHAMNQPAGAAAVAGTKSWKPWFPVIDYDRCTNCMQCLSFCLFDVYGVDSEQRIQVQNQDNCKTNCPACSRVCPEVAIMFPKYKAGPINGAPVRQEDLNREKMKVDISALLGGDIYSNLRQRSEAAKSRFAKERSPDKALDERKRCLTKLQSDGIIPTDVLEEIDLASLPSMDDIQRKAKEAAAKAQAALDAQKPSE